MFVPATERRDRSSTDHVEVIERFAAEGAAAIVVVDCDEARAAEVAVGVGVVSQAVRTNIAPPSDYDRWLAGIRRFRSRFSSSG